jgi:hypothetical protein
VAKRYGMKLKTKLRRNATHLGACRGGRSSRVRDRGSGAPAGGEAPVSAGGSAARARRGRGGDAGGVGARGGGGFSR